MENTKIEISCDAPGCRSRCELGAKIMSIAELVAELDRRGWQDRGGKHYCPAHVTITTHEDARA